MSKKLVAYFSASGVTAAVAEQLAKAAGAVYTKSSPKHPTPRRILTGQIKARAAQ